MTKQQLIQQAKNIFAHKKSDKEKICENYYKLALKNTAFHTNDTNIRSVNLQIAKKEFENKDTSVENELLQVLLKQRRQIIKELNLNEKYFEPQYDCNICKDTGVTDNGYCICFKKLLSKLIKQNFQDKVDDKHIFKNSKLDDLDPNYKLYDTMQKWCKKYPDVKTHNINILGSTGCGKTYLTECMANYLSEKNVLVQFLTAFNFNTLMTKYHTTFNETRNMYLDTVLDCEVLIIDDLGTEPINKNVTLEYLYLVINERQLNNKTTIITSNLTLENILDRYGERIFSRLYNKQVSLTLQMLGKDKRISKK